MMTAGSISAHEFFEGSCAVIKLRYTNSTITLVIIFEILEKAKAGHTNGIQLLPRLSYYAAETSSRYGKREMPRL